MIILGINAYHGDAAACLLKDGLVVAACEEEKLRRIKHCAGFPASAIQTCLNQAGIGLNEIDKIAISRNPKANLTQKLLFTAGQGIKLAQLVKSRLKNAARIVRLKDELERALHSKVSRQTKIHQVEHHLAHLASTFFAAPFEEAAFLSVDGFGDFVSTKWGYGTGQKLTITGQVEFPHSLGIFYTAVTQYLGFPHYGDEYKVMALAAYGTPRYQSEFRKIIAVHPEKGFRLDLDYFIHHTTGVEMNWDERPKLSPCFSQKMIDCLGPAREPLEPLTERHYALAASLQTVFEEIYFHLLNQLYEKTHLKNICLAGGCAFNSVANGKIRERTPFKQVFIQPAAGDSGTALGAALYVCHSVLNQPRQFQMRHVYFGPRFTQNEIKLALGTASLDGTELSEEEMIKRTAQALASGKIVGWFQGNAEFGPRALGNRSLLADPRRSDMKEILNQRIKHRENFRPFAPSILAEHWTDFVDAGEPDPFMICVYKIKSEKRPIIPAVTHVDGTGRFQAVAQDTNPKFWRLIHEFKRLTGVPLVLNTSFNDNEPIVLTPQDAVRCFMNTEIDCLVIENYWVERNHDSGLKKPEKEIRRNDVILAQ